MKTETDKQSKLPERSFFSMEEIAKQWGCDTETIESYVYDHKILRLSVQSQYVQEFHGKGRISCKVLSSMEDISSMYQHLDRHEQVEVWKELGLESSYADNSTNSEFYGDLIWDSPPPRLIYLNFDVGLVERGTDTLETKTLRLSRDEKILFSKFETFSGISYGVFESEKETPIIIAVEAPVISKRERDRFVARYASKPSVKDVELLSEQQKLQMIIGAAAQLLMNTEGHSFFSESDTDDAKNKKIADYVLKWVEVEGEGGLKVRNIKAEIKEGLALLAGS